MHMIVVSSTIFTIQHSKIEALKKNTAYKYDKCQNRNTIVEQELAEKTFFLHFGSRHLCNKNSEKMLAICIHFCRLIACEMSDKFFYSGS
jgi:hypothetical protein